MFSRYSDLPYGTDINFYIVFFFTKLAVSIVIKKNSVGVIPEHIFPMFTPDPSAPTYILGHSHPDPGEVPRAVERLMSVFR